MTLALDLFAGPGGWDLGARELGLDPLGVEWDDAACATRAAAGLRTVQGDVSALDPQRFAPVELLIASPPCQAFSMAGKGRGRAAVPIYAEAIERWMEGKPPPRAELDEACEDDRAHLVLEPLRWALALRPRLIACEQVEPVLPLWEQIARALGVAGYRTWTGVLSAERYGVPQTRKRAILMGSLDGVPVEPPASHQRYVPRRKGRAQSDSLFELDEGRIVLPEDRELTPWISMAEALGWDERDGVGFPRRNDRDDGAAYRERDRRAASEPAFALTEKARSWTRQRPSTAVMGDPRIAPPGYRGGKRDYEQGIEPDSMFTPRERESEPRDPGWPSERPATTVAGDPRATTVAGDPRIAQPGHKNEKMSPDSPGRMEGAIRVSIEEAAVLQGFPRDYPVRGTRTAKYRQIGDAVPPPLACAVLATLLATRGSTDASR